MTLILNSAFKNALDQQLVNYVLDHRDDACSGCRKVSENPYSIVWLGQLDLEHLVDRFRSVYLEKDTPKVIKTSVGRWEIADDSVKERWVDFHDRNSKLWLVCAGCRSKLVASTLNFLCAP